MRFARGEARTALAVSPHLDDAVFSAGGVLGALADRGWRVVVATVFTRSVAGPEGFALACQLDKGLGADVDYMALRRAEDRAACEVLGLEPAWLDFPEAPHRGYHSARALFEAAHADDRAAVEIAPAIAGAIADCEAALVLGPQAIGGHVDHVATVEALRGLGLATPALWWRDFPYDLRGGVAAAPFGEVFGGMTERDVGIDRGRKIEACGAYRSQISFQFGGEAGLAAAVRNEERFATVDASAPAGYSGIGAQAAWMATIFS